MNRLFYTFWKCKPRYNAYFNKSYHAKSNCNKMIKHLAAFDFDHTILNDNSDTVVAGLLEKDVIPDSVKQLYRKDGWTAYMQGIFELLYKYGIEKSTIVDAVKEIVPVNGICELIREMTEKYNYDIIIISDSNTYFIQTWLEAQNLLSNIYKVFTNPAEFHNGLLKIKMYHLQDYCKLSTKNLCKGQILDDFLKHQQLKDINYDHVVFVGDGVNDFCPILRLKENDLGCVREGYKCAKLVKQTQQELPVELTGEVYNIRANICMWNSGYDILDAIKSINN